MQLGNILKELLSLYDITQKQLAEMLDLSPSALGNYIHGTREPDYRTLVQIADYFHVTTDFLLSHTARRESPGSASHREELLLHIFRSLTEEQQEFYLEQEQIFLRQNRKKESSLSSPGRGNDWKAS